MSNDVLEVNDECLMIDHEGRFTEYSDWSEQLAIIIANREGNDMSDDAW